MLAPMTGIHRVELESGYVVGSVNAWLIAVTGFDAEAVRCDRLVAYRSSLAESLHDLDGLVLPGHGASFEAPREVIARHLASHDAQAEKVLGLLDASEASTARRVAERLWPRTALTWPFLSACTVLGVLGWLEAERRVERTALEDGLVGYRSA
jgi:hypothetical protein